MHDRDARNAWFKSTILAHEPALRRQLRRMSLPAVEIDDVVAETLARAYVATDWERIDQGRSYLFTIARNLLTDAARRKAVVSFDLMADLEVLNVVDGAGSAEDAVSVRDELRRLQTIIDSLPPQCRRVFVMRRVQERSTQEIAAELAVSTSTVEKHLTKAIALVTRALAEHQPPQQKSGPSWRKVKETR
ncbi:RNA polymerase sigma factor [Steroidobacter sp.]|uniref:RNA polymerase sigma factor n=1 Tax=Steroidobacter sp. TaxID=1978227 RepID=UPI001A3ACDA6|nr:sigma-70 family RNA polymerase sigma factor [Steroidobacter sp.]MBL8267233.1 sigma-70 family RNA polymerase sigma factor [Steroidobacter sp.]